MAHRSQSSATPRERRLSRVRSLFVWPQAGGQSESEPKEETATAVSDWTGPTSRAAHRVSFLDVQDPPEHPRLSVPPVFDFLSPSEHNWNAMSVRSRRSKATPPPLDIPEDAIAGPSSSVATLPLPSHPHDSQTKNQFFKRALRRHGSFSSLRTLAVFSTRPGDRSSVESTYSTSADSEHSLSGTTAYSPSDYGDFENDKGKDFCLDTDEKSRRPVLVTPLKPDYPFDGCEGLLELDRETNDVLSHLTPPGCPSFLRWDQAPTRILDIGCGFGDWTAQAATVWPFAMITGIDVNSRWDATLERIIPANASFEEHDFLDEPLPFKDNTFDYVRIANCQFRIKAAHWSFLLSEVYRVLQIDGHLELIDEDTFSPELFELSVDSSDSPADRLLDFDEEPRNMDDKMLRNAQELETIFHHALNTIGLESSLGTEGHLYQALRSAFGSSAETPSLYELCASMPKAKKTSKFFGAVPREQCIILKSAGLPGLRRLSVDTHHALRGSNALLASQDFLHSFVEQQRDAEGRPLVKRKELDDAFWDYRTFRERRFHWRSERHGAAFDDDADVIIARSRPGPRRSDGGDTGSMVGSMRRAFERTSIGSDTHPYSSRRTMERSYSFGSDVTPQPCDEPRSYMRWAPGEAYELVNNRKPLPLRRIKVYIASKGVQQAPAIPLRSGMAGWRESFMQRTKSSTPISQSSQSDSSLP